MTPQRLADLSGYSRQQIARFEDRTRRLGPDAAVKLGIALGGIPGSQIAYSKDDEAYSWASKAVRVIGTIGHGMQVHMLEKPESWIGAAPDTPERTVALRILPEAHSLIAGWYLHYDESVHTKVTPEALELQTDGARFISCLEDGTMWWRNLAAGGKRNHYHLSAPNVDPIFDTKVTWISKILHLGPGFELPPDE